MEPEYIAMGMSHELYWKGDPFAVKAYRKAEKIRKEKENTRAWLQGLYFYRALVDVSPMLDVFNSHRKPNEYLDRPIDIYKPSDEEVKKRNMKIQQRGIENMKMWAETVNASKKVKGVINDGRNSKS